MPALLGPVLGKANLRPWCGRLADIPEIAAALHNPWAGRDISGLYLAPARMRTPSCIK